MPSVDFEGRPVELRPGDSVASALHRAGVRTFSRSFKFRRPRGLYCLTGDCPNCLLTVDGEPAVRACCTPAHEGQKVRRDVGWPSAAFDVFSIFWFLRRLLPVGFYYKTFLHPRGLWPVMDRVIRRLVGLGPVPRDLPPARRETCHHHPDIMVVGGGVAGLSAALAAAEAGQTVLLAEEHGFGEQIAPGDTRNRIDALLQSLRAQSGVTLLEGAAAVGIFEGPLVPVAAPDFLHYVHPARIVVATGAVERHVVFPGSDLLGVWLGRGAARLAGVHGDLPGRTIVFAGETPESITHLAALVAAGARVRAAVVPQRLVAKLPAVERVVPGGRVVVARGAKRVRAVVVESPRGREAFRCDAVVLSLGLEPRDGLLRQAPPGAAVVGAGEAVRPGLTLPEAEDSGRRAAVGRPDVPVPSELPAWPAGGFVCLCEDVMARDLEDAWTEGYQSTEILKRYTTATMGPCQGALCQAHLRSFARAQGGTGWTSGPTTARPPIRPIRLEDAAAGLGHLLDMRTALHQRHVAAGAHLELAGPWSRPQTYGDTLAEYWAVRRGVSVMDVGTLGKFLVAGRDAVEFLERLYPCHVRDIAEGRLRYALLLNEAGYLLDDGLIGSLGSAGFYLTFTSSGAEGIESWLLDWVETWKLKVHVVNQTAALGAINVAGPRARELVQRLTSDPIDNQSFPYARHREVTVAGVRCRALRVGFVGELSIELHHSRSESVRLWDALLEAGRDLGVRPHGLDALRLLRLEKGHILIGQDTDFDTTPAKLGLDFAVRLDKPYFVGKPALARISKIPFDQRLVAVAFEGPAAPFEGAVLTVAGHHVGHLTSARFSPVLGHGVGLGWVRRHEGEFPTAVQVEGVRGKVVQGAFYDPRGVKLRA
ncbi:MAG: (2Fe-2S)-binding protein [Gemmatimonadetes bacterium]|nr:(2Fe-2S)-binding protein [Gemmatimonadota bacterium]